MSRVFFFCFQSVFRGCEAASRKEKVQVEPPAKTPLSARWTSRREKKTQTMEALSSLLHADPRLSIRESLSRGGDIPRRPTAFKHLLLSPLRWQRPAPPPSPNQGCSCSWGENEKHLPPRSHPSRGDEATGVFIIHVVF